jgi:hypothetical protein
MVGLYLNSHYSHTVIDIVCVSSMMVRSAMEEVSNSGEHTHTRPDILERLSHFLLPMVRRVFSTFYYLS